MRQNKSILRKIKEWQHDPLLVTGLYRLFTYIPWEDVPKEYKKFFDSDAKKVWNDDLKTYKDNNIRTDMIIQVKGILRSSVNKNYVQILGIMPMLLADMFVLGYSVDYILKRLIKLKDGYVEFIELDRESTEAYTFLEIVNILEEIITRSELILDFDITTIRDRIINQHNKLKEQNNLNVLVDKDSAKVKNELEYNPFAEDIIDG